LLDAAVGKVLQLQAQFQTICKYITGANMTPNWNAVASFLPLLLSWRCAAHIQHTSLNNKNPKLVALFAGK